MVAAALLLACPTVSAATPDEIEVARKLFSEAEKHQKNSEWDQALKKLERVVVIKETAGVRFHIAVCHEKLGSFVKALQNYERAKRIATETNATDVLELVDSEIARMKARVGGVSIEVPKGVGPAIVHVDQSVYSDLPSGEVIDLEPGTHQVIVVIDGKVRLDRLVSVDEGQKETVHVRDWREPEPAPSPVASKDEGHVTADAGHGSAVVPTAVWISFGAGAALGIGGYLAYSKADSLADESAEVCAASVSCDPARADQVRRWDAAALGLWVGAAVGVGAGIALTLTNDGGKATNTAMIVSPNQVKLRTTF